MTTEKDLMEIRSFPRILEKMCSDLRSASSKPYPASPILSAMPKGSPNYDNIPDAIVSLEEERHRLSCYVARIHEIEQRAWSDTMKIPDPGDRNTIILYYFNRIDTWPDVADVMDYSLAQVKRHRDAALKFLASC